MMKIRRGQIADAPVIARLIIEAMTEECCAYYYGPHFTIGDFHKFMTGLVMDELSQYSYKNTIVAGTRTRIVGIATSYNGADLAVLREAFLNGMFKVFQRDFRGKMVDETQAGELYLDSLAVEPSFRRCGVGSLLLEATVKKAQLMKIPYVGLLVDDANPSALKLYEEVGFSFVNNTTWGGHYMKHLQLKVEGFSFKRLTCRQLPFL